MSVIHIQTYKTKLGELILGDYQGQLCLLDWRYRKMRKTVDNRLQRALKADYVEQDTPVLQAARQQLDAYFIQQQKTFDLPLLLVGTDFQKQVWQALMQIPYGQTATYLELSRLLGNEKAIRAVANANGANALSIIVPCHRIIGSDGSLVGYAGGLEAKQSLLAIESEQMTWL